MEAKDVKHGIHVTVNSERVWEVLDRSPRANSWWLHRWNEDGNWEYTDSHVNNMTLVSAGARQETLAMELETV